MLTYNQLQLREIFHLEFLRSLSRKLLPEHYALKGGVNLRFFFKSFRYSEDMDIDVSGVRVDILKDLVMKTLRAPHFLTSLRSYGIERIIPPAIAKAKQTETRQRFKIHLITSASEDLFTKIEFSRRGYKGNAVVQSVSALISKDYHMPPLLVSHYEITSAASQKINALAGRAAVQARDIFDVYILSSQCEKNNFPAAAKISGATVKKAIERIFRVEYHQFRDTVVSYLSVENARIYGVETAWDEIKLKAAQFLEDL